MCRGTWACHAPCQLRHAPGTLSAGFAVASGIAIPAGSGVMAALHGPLIVIIGIAAALVGGLLCRWDALQDPNRAARNTQAR